MERLQRLGWVKEAKGAYLQAAAEAFVRETEGGTRLDRTLAVSPTWAENHRFTDAIRSRLKQAGALTEGQEIIAHHSLQWTRQQIGDPANYRPGLVVTFNRKTAGIARGQSSAAGFGILFFHSSQLRIIIIYLLRFFLPAFSPLFSQAREQVWAPRLPVPGFSFSSWKTTHSS